MSKEQDAFFIITTAEDSGQVKRLLNLLEPLDYSAIRSKFNKKSLENVFPDIFVEVAEKTPLKSDLSDLNLILSRVNWGRDLFLHAEDLLLFVSSRQHLFKESRAALGSILQRIHPYCPKKNTDLLFDLFIQYGALREPSHHKGSIIDMFSEVSAKKQYLAYARKNKTPDSVEKIKKELKDQIFLENLRSDMRGVLNGSLGSVSDASKNEDNFKNISSKMLSCYVLTPSLDEVHKIQDAFPENLLDKVLNIEHLCSSYLTWSAHAEARFLPLVPKFTPRQKKYFLLAIIMQEISQDGNPSRQKIIEDLLKEKVTPCRPKMTSVWPENVCSISRSLEHLFYKEKKSKNNFLIQKSKWIDSLAQKGVLSEGCDALLRTLFTAYDIPCPKSLESVRHAPIKSSVFADPMLEKAEQRVLAALSKEQLLGSIPLHQTASPKPKRKI